MSMYFKKKGKIQSLMNSIGKKKKIQVLISIDVFKSTVTSKYQVLMVYKLNFLNFLLAKTVFFSVRTETFPKLSPVLA